MAPPDSAFHAQTRLRKASRPIVRRSGSCASTSIFSTTICVAMPAWSVPGCQSTSRPFIRCSGQNVLQRVVERVPHVQIAGHVRRRDDHAERLGSRPIGPARPERPGLFPKRGNAALDRSGVKRFVHHGSAVRAWPRGAAHHDRMRAHEAATRGHVATALSASRQRKSTREKTESGPLSAFRAQRARSRRAPVSRQCRAGFRRATP